MKNRKKLQQLRLKDSFMFDAGMIHEKICKEFLEMQKCRFVVRRILEREDIITAR